MAPFTANKHVQQMGHNAFSKFNKALVTCDQINTCVLQESMYSRHSHSVHSLLLAYYSSSLLNVAHTFQCNTVHFWGIDISVLRQQCNNRIVTEAVDIIQEKHYAICIQHILHFTT